MILVVFATPGESQATEIAQLNFRSGSKRQRFQRYPIGVFHIDIAEVQTAEGKLYLFVGIDRTSKFAVTQLLDKADRRTTWEFLELLMKAVPGTKHLAMAASVPA